MVGFDVGAPVGQPFEGGFDAGRWNEPERRDLKDTDQTEEDAQIVVAFAESGRHHGGLADRAYQHLGLGICEAGRAGIVTMQHEPVECTLGQELLAGHCGGFVGLGVGDLEIRLGVRGGYQCIGRTGAVGFALLPQDRSGFVLPLGQNRLARCRQGAQPERQQIDAQAQRRRPLPLRIGEPEGFEAGSQNGNAAQGFFVARGRKPQLA